MSFVLQKVPAVLHSCEMHGKRAKRANADQAPSREKRVALSLDVTDKKFSRILDEAWPGSDLLIKAMSGADSAAQDIVSRRKMQDVSLKVWAFDGTTQIFAIDVARAMGRPTLRIGQAAAKVQLSLRLVGPINGTFLKAIDDHCEADVYVDVSIVQSHIDDFIDGENAEGSPDDKAIAVVGRGKGKGAKGGPKANGKVTLDVSEPGAIV